MEIMLADSKPQASWWARAAVAVAALGVTALTGCDRAPEGWVDEPGGRTVLEASDVQVIGTSESLAIPRDLEVLSDGSVWVLNSVEPLFIGFSPGGEVIHTYGALGGGPEEFRSPAGFVSGGIDGEAWVFDMHRSALIEVAGPDAPWSQISLPRDSLPPGSVIPGRDLTASSVRTARLGGEIVFARTSGSIQDGIYSFWTSNWGADLLALDPTTGSARGIVSLGEVLGDPTPHLAITDKFPFWHRLWTVCPDDQIRVFDRLRNEVRAFTADGDELAPTALPPVRGGGITHRQFARAALGFLMAERLGEVRTDFSAADSTRLLNEVVAEAEGDPDDLATLLPRYVDLRCGEEGILWLRPFDIDVGGLKGGPTWLRIRPDGTIDEVRLPDRFDAYRFTSDRIWGMQRDSLDIASVAWIAVPEVR